MENSPEIKSSRAPLGIFDSLKQLLGTVAAIAQTRIELLGTEVEEQVAHLSSMFFWTIVALFLAFTTVVLLAVAVLVAFWDNNRVLAAVLLAGGFGLLGLLSWWRVRTLVQRRPHLFQATLEELGKDREHLGGR